MCLYPRIIENRKYRANKKNGGKIPPLTDQRVRYVPIGCQTCIECRKQKAREWLVRLQEDIKTYTNGKFITLTYRTESLKKIYHNTDQLKLLKGLKDYQGYDLDNEIATRTVRLFLERWRKKFKKSLRHWLVTELGHGNTEHMHLHGIVWTDNINDIEPIWSYGNIWKGNIINGKLQNYVNARTVNYITKYVTKMDEKHLNYKPIILTSPGIGNNYANTSNFRQHEYIPKKTNDLYRTSTGHKMAMPIYWRNKRYSEEQREKLWLERLDKGERYVCGERIRKGDDKTYYKVLDYYRQKTAKLGYPSPSFIWSKKTYEEQKRRLKQQERLKKEGWIK